MTDKMIGMRAVDMLQEVTKYRYRDRGSGEECSIVNLDLIRGVIQVKYEDGSLQEYNLIAGPPSLIAIGRLEDEVINMDVTESGVQK